jgi:hypothetical protein
MCGCSKTNGAGGPQGAGQTRQTDRTQMNDPMRNAMKNKGQLDENQLQNYLQARSANAAQNQQAMDARMLAESMKANGIGAS